MIGYVYELVCPITNEPKYVGSTINTKERLKEHIRNIKKGKSEMAKYFNELGVVPELNILEFVRGHSWNLAKLRDVEYFCIDAYVSIGYELFNCQKNKNKRITYKSVNSLN